MTEQTKISSLQNNPDENSESTRKARTLRKKLDRLNGNSEWRATAGNLCEFLGEGMNDKTFPHPFDKMISRAVQLLGDRNQAIIVGGLALYFRTGSLQTEDLDLMLLDPVMNIEDKLQRSNTFEILQTVEGDFLETVRAATDVGDEPRIVDFLKIHPEKFHQTLIERATPEPDSGVPVVSVEDLILLKLIANRPEDREAIRSILTRHGTELDLDHINQWGGKIQEEGEDLLDRLKEVLSNMPRLLEQSWAKDWYEQL